MSFFFFSTKFNLLWNNSGDGIFIRMGENKRRVRKDCKTNRKHDEEKCSGRSDPMMNWKHFKSLLPAELQKLRVHFYYLSPFRSYFLFLSPFLSYFLFPSRLSFYFLFFSDFFLIFSFHFFLIFSLSSFFPIFSFSLIFSSFLSSTFSYFSFSSHLFLLSLYHTLFFLNFLFISLFFFFFSSLFSYFLFISVQLSLSLSNTHSFPRAVYINSSFPSIDGWALPGQLAQDAHRTNEYLSGFQLKISEENWSSAHLWGDTTTNPDDDAEDDEWGGGGGLQKELRAVLFLRKIKNNFWEFEIMKL